MSFKTLFTEDYEHNTLKNYLNIVEPKFSHLPLVTCLWVKGRAIEDNPNTQRLSHLNRYAACLVLYPIIDIDSCSNASDVLYEE